RRPVGLVVIIIEAALADRDDARMIGGLGQYSGAEVRMRIGLVRMDSDAGPDVGFALGNGDDLVPLALTRGDVEEPGDAGFTRIFKHLCLPLYQAFVIEVAVAVD